MAKARFEYCPMCALRAAVEARLNVPADQANRQGPHEAPTSFWSRMEAAGLLGEAVDLYDKLVVEQRTRPRQETKQEFKQRVEKEGRQDEAKRLRAELLAHGLSQREAQEKL